MFDVLTCILFGVAGYILRTFNFDLGPFVLGFILGPILEMNFRQTMVMSDGSFMIFFERPVPLVIMSGVVLATLWFAYDSRRRKSSQRISSNQFAEAKRTISDRVGKPETADSESAARGPIAEEAAAQTTTRRPDQESPGGRRSHDDEPQ